MFQSVIKARLKQKKQKKAKKDMLERMTQKSKQVKKAFYNYDYRPFKAYGICKVKLNNNTTCIVACSYHGMVELSEPNYYNNFDYNVDISTIEPLYNHEYYHTRYDKKLKTWVYIVDGLRPITDILEVLHDYDFDIEF